MTNLHYKTVLNNSPEYVFEKLFDKQVFKQWTRIFNPTSDYSGTFGLGEEILFHDADGNGMLTLITQYEINKTIKFVYIASLNNGQKTLFQTTENYECYTFTNNGNHTMTFDIDLNIPDEYVEMFEEMWPIAINYIQDLFNAN